MQLRYTDWTQELVKLGAAVQHLETSGKKRIAWRQILGLLDRCKVVGLQQKVLKVPHEVHMPTLQ